MINFQELVVRSFDVSHDMRLVAAEVLTCKDDATGTALAALQGRCPSCGERNAAWNSGPWDLPRGHTWKTLPARVDCVT